MPKHNTYEQDENISDNDIVLGSDADDNLKTKNFRIGKLKDYFISFVETIVGPQGPQGEVGPQGPPGQDVDSRPYKVYTALLTQSGTNAPVATVLENTLGEITWTRGSFGQYTGNSSEILTLNKTLVFITDNYNCFSIPKPLSKITLEPHPSVDTILVLQTGGTSSEIHNGLLDDMLLNTPIEIRVYD